MPPPTDNLEVELIRRSWAEISSRTRSHFSPDYWDSPSLRRAITDCRQLTQTGHFVPTADETAEMWASILAHSFRVFSGCQHPENHEPVRLVLHRRRYRETPLPLAGGGAGGDADPPPPREHVLLSLEHQRAPAASSTNSNGGTVIISGARTCVHVLCMDVHGPGDQVTRAEARGLGDRYLTPEQQGRTLGFFVAKGHMVGGYSWAPAPPYEFRQFLWPGDEDANYCLYEDCTQVEDLLRRMRRVMHRIPNPEEDMEPWTMNDDCWL
ncbi:uncharacterized protein BP01DRAFT_402548 [Aspergillus saccharolyticus JOP 1030-1]|uniref:Uncharacterized protein n=1 Tax=Aspergillus saccharolyticus JOP 1030-1 TaxID=1450539 RepID=A0A318Z8B0_9EURO|nr:hypothetical protein BP01DRAFT_402548 [Aspergillus saccharolyticus JOP 1030-1]PYH43466.1 hypothetical protein BP01DRAFT_402548 [Aspergillus saccharolyticus JOP 1030-1]